MMSLSCDWPKCLFTITLALSQLIEEQGQQAKFLSWACTQVCTLVPNGVRLHTNQETWQLAWVPIASQYKSRVKRVPSTRLVYIFKVSWEGELQKRPQHQQDIVCVCVNIFLRICLRVRVFDLDIVCVAVFVKILSRPC